MLYSDDNGFLWNVNKKVPTGIYLNCVRKPARKGGCKATAFIKMSHPGILFEASDHNHEDDAAEIKQRRAILKMKMRARQESTQLKTIFDEERAKLPHFIAKEIVYNKICSTLSKQRSKFNYPPYGE